MTERMIDFESYEDADSRLLAWVRANGLDPWQLPRAQSAVIEDGNLTVTEWILEQTVPGAPPHKTLREDGSGYKNRLRTVPLLSAPEDHGL